MSVATIPHGIAVGNLWLRKVLIREMNGYDEQLISEMQDYPIPFKTTALLGTIVRFVDDINTSNVVAIVRKLTAGDRIALILQIRKLTYGNDFQFHLKCADCQKIMTVDLLITELLQPSKEAPRSEYSLNVQNIKLRIRPVTGTDLESLFRGDSLNKSEELTLSCVIASDPPIQKPVPEDILLSISYALEEIDPQANLVLDLICPSCSSSFSISFNIEDFIFHEINNYSKRSEHETHWLAFNYHWSEHSILSLPFKRRRRYVNLINTTLHGESI